MKHPQCPQCHTDNREGARFCQSCGGKLDQQCPACGNHNSPTATFCDSCGTRLPQPSSGLSALPSSPQPQSPASYTPPHLIERILAEQTAREGHDSNDGERKTITALFADIKGSTSLIEDLDPEEARAIIDPTLQIMMNAVHRYDGYVTQVLGDGIFALFGAPLAQEDHPRRAIYAALLMQEEGKKHAERLRREQGINVQIRVGINTGEVVVRSIRKDNLHTDYTPVGHSTHLAARMEGLATPGSVFVSEYTHRLTEGYFDFTALGPALLKGVSDPVNVYEVVGVGPLRTRLQVATKRGLVRFVGRQSELDSLRRALDLSKNGHGQIVSVMGEPGVGKSRLFHEFKLIAQQGCLLLETFSVSHGKAYPYLPLIDLLKNYFQITTSDEERRRREKITGKVLTLDRGLEDTLPYLFTLLGVVEPTATIAQMDAQIRKRRTLDAIKRLLVRESLNQPMIVIFEDLHWLDVETQAFLSLFSDSVATAKILLLTNYRPEYHHEWGNKLFFSQVRLDPLRQADAEEMLTALLGDTGGTDASLHDLRRFILEKTDGNPFFMEEIVQELREQGFLTVGASAPVTIPTELRLPPTVQGILAARIDRLPAPEKAFLQMLSVLGDEMPLSLIRQVSGATDDDMHRALAHLQTAEFIHERPAFPEPEYTFKHALTQEVAYNSLLIERRKALHERTARIIESLFTTSREDYYETLAHHYRCSGNTEKAIEYLHLAGQQAVRRSATADAITFLTSALDLLNTLPDTPDRARHELTLQLALGPAFNMTKGFGSSEMGQTYSRARELCARVGDRALLFSTLMGLRVLHTARGQHQAARALGKELVHLADEATAPALLVAAHYAIVPSLYYLGEFASVLTHCEQSLSRYDRAQHDEQILSYGQSYAVMTLCYAAYTRYMLGFPDQALRKVHEALRLAQELAHPLSYTQALISATTIHLFLHRSQEAHVFAESLIMLAEEHGIPQQISTGTALRGWAMSQQGQGARGIEHLQRGLALTHETGTQIWRTAYLAQLADAHGQIGNPDEGLRIAREALADVERMQERMYEAEIHRITGVLAFQSQASLEQVPDKSKASQDKSENISPQPLTPSTQEAEACFLKSIAIAQQQGAKSLELRATMSLARLWQQQGKQHEARQALSAIYNWFTEGFETVDLQEAKALIEELSHRMTGGLRH